MFAVQIKIEVIDTETGEVVNSRGLTQQEALRLAGPSHPNPVGGFPLVTCTRMKKEWPGIEDARRHLNNLFALMRAAADL